MHRASVANPTGGEQPLKTRDCRDTVGPLTLPTMNSPTQTSTQPIVQRLSHARTDTLLGGSIAIRLRSEDTDGRLGLIEQVVPAGYPGPPLHVHPDFDETFYVIDGTLAFRVGDDTMDAGPGTVAFVPRGTPHTFANRSSAAVRSLVLVNPGGFERYFEALAAMIRDADGLPNPERIAALGVEHGSVPV
jgi:mannose-6-phosphate isomerase-like protein (cupin superfamily)